MGLVIAPKFNFFTEFPDIYDMIRPLLRCGMKKKSEFEKKRGIDNALGQASVEGQCVSPETTKDLSRVAGGEITAEQATRNILKRNNLRKHDLARH